MTKFNFVLFVLMAFLAANPLSVVASGKHEESETHAEEEKDHEHSEQEQHSEEEADGHEHGKEKSGEHAHGSGEGEGEHAEGNKAVGPDKGILEANERSGFKLSEEAWKNFGIRTIDASTPGIYTLARRSIFFGLQERNVYRLRDGYFKRVDFAVISKSGSEYRIQIKDLRVGDKIVTSGLGFLRIAEIAAFGGVGEGHAH